MWWGYKRIQQTTYWWYFTYFSQKTGFDISGKLSLMETICPADTWHLYNVASTSMQRHDVESTLRRRCINVMCPLGAYDVKLCFLGEIKKKKRRNISVCRLLKFYPEFEPQLGHVTFAEIDRESIHTAMFALPGHLLVTGESIHTRTGTGISLSRNRVSRITLKAPITKIVVCFFICLWLKVIFANSVDPD